MKSARERERERERRTRLRSCFTDDDDTDVEILPPLSTVGKAYYDLLGQVTYNTSDGADWTKGAIMFDFPSYRPTIGDHKRFNEPFCK